MGRRATQGAAEGGFQVVGDRLQAGTYVVFDESQDAKANKYHAAPPKTLRLIDRVASRGDRSSVIDKAVKRYVAQSQNTKLKKQIKEGALRRAKRDLQLAE